MWTISLFKVRDALGLKAQRCRARSALKKAPQLAGDNADLTQAIRMAVCEAEIAVTTMISADKHALSGPQRAA